MAIDIWSLCVLIARWIRVTAAAAGSPASCPYCSMGRYEGDADAAASLHNMTVIIVSLTGQPQQTTL